jgi:hypothetical protein
VKLVPLEVRADGFASGWSVEPTIVIALLVNFEIEPVVPCIVADAETNVALWKSARVDREQVVLHISGLSTIHSAELLWAPETLLDILKVLAVLVSVKVVVNLPVTLEYVTLAVNLLPEVTVIDPMATENFG